MALKANPTEVFAAICFVFAIVHTFSVKSFQKLAHRFPQESAGDNFLHLLGEVEIVFGVWAGVFLIFIAFARGAGEAIHYLESCNFTEAAFVFVIMVVCATRPILTVVGILIDGASILLPVKRPIAVYATCLILGPLLGSLITEPAAMTVTALLLLDRFYKRGMSQKFMYATLGLLLVNVSIGGVLTPYAAPPVLMVAKTWKWDLKFMLTHFGWKAALSIILGTCFVTFRFRKELAAISWEKKSSHNGSSIPIWLYLIHVIFLALIVLSAHHLTVFVGIFLFFLGLISVTREHQEELQLRKGLLVAFFLGGLVVLGGPQRWWLAPLIRQLNAFLLYFGSITLTAFLDNAALTYLGSLVPGLSAFSKYILVAGAITGGGLTVMANAPNPAGYGMLNSSFGEDGISPLHLFLNALPPTLIALLIFWFL